MLLGHHKPGMSSPVLTRHPDSQDRGYSHRQRAVGVTTPRVHATRDEGPARCEDRPRRDRGGSARYRRRPPLLRGQAALRRRRTFPRCRTRDARGRPRSGRHERPKPSSSTPSRSAARQDKTTWRPFGVSQLSTSPSALSDAATSLIDSGSATTSNPRSRRWSNDGFGGACRQAARWNARLALIE